MKTWFTATIQASNMQDLPSHTEVFSSFELFDKLCIKLPDSLPRDTQLSGLFDITNNKEIDFTDHITRNENRPWIDIDISILSTASGQHVYRLVFTKAECELNASCFFSYIIQDTFVDRPYIYMKREEKEDSEGEQE